MVKLSAPFGEVLKICVVFCVVLPITQLETEYKFCATPSFMTTRRSSGAVRKRHKTTLLNSYGAGAWMGVSANDQGGTGKEIRWNGWEQENKGGKKYR